MVRFAFYGDDFTGSIDALLQFRRTGLDGVLVTSPEALAGVTDADVVGIAGIARSLPTAELEAEVRPALEALLALRPDVLQYKACSTADSSPEMGSLGRVIEIGRALVGTSPVPVLLAQPDFGRYTAFSHHFAADRGEVYRLDRQPTMANHPVTPATESDLRVHIGAQTDLWVGGVHWPSFAAAWSEAVDNDGGDLDVVVLDTLTDDHLREIGAVLNPRFHRTFDQVPISTHFRSRFVLGSGGLSRALGLGVQAEAGASAVESALKPGGVQNRVETGVGAAAGPTLVLSGSASALTWRQVEAATAAGFTALDLFAEATHDEAVRLTREDGAVVVFSSRPDVPRSASSVEVEERLAAIGTAVLRTRPDTRLVVAGGDTSGNVLRRLGVDTLRITGTPWGMVALCRAEGSAEHLRGGVEVALKGGQMGHDNLFDDIRSGTPLRP
ncbi:four-carbon acid sugar kinase family protein [Pseudactinotalea suaedae]|uniref:four-carbon acid sugar kinase family protein n=1 Tax=Pseudactinotalea suaedae TaxID=1524924 RepID=UPI0012E1E718|nr:four-carbon acid sugar kinase family protein [Pseudactinotalea suaedae]